MADNTWERRERRWLERIDAANREGGGWVPDELLANDEPTWRARYDLKLWIGHLFVGAAYLPS